VRQFTQEFENAGSLLLLTIWGKGGFGYLKAYGKHKLNKELCKAKEGRTKNGKIKTRGRVQTEGKAFVMLKHDSQTELSEHWNELGWIRNFAVISRNVYDVLRNFVLQHSYPPS
jgi:hypothetical protein